jgi:starvation-inducible DNA-binding protein
MTRYLEKNNQKQVVELLEHILGDTFMLYMKTHAYHWNVEGPQFHSLHEMFEEQYTDMWKALDDLAERLRALGAYAPLNAAEMQKLSDISPASKTPNAMQMVKDLAQDNEVVSEHIQAAIQKMMEMGDEATADMLIARQQAHDKNAWMLNATAA